MFVTLKNLKMFMRKPGVLTYTQTMLTILILDGLNCLFVWSVPHPNLSVPEN